MALRSFARFSLLGTATGVNRRGGAQPEKIVFLRDEPASVM